MLYFFPTELVSVAVSNRDNARRRKKLVGLITKVIRRDKEFLKPLNDINFRPEVLSIFHCGPNNGNKSFTCEQKCLSAEEPFK